MLIQDVSNANKENVNKKHKQDSTESAISCG